MVTEIYDICGRSARFGSRMTSFPTIFSTVSRALRKDSGEKIADMTYAFKAIRVLSLPAKMIDSARHMDSSFTPFMNSGV